MARALSKVIPPTCFNFTTREVLLSAKPVSFGWILWLLALFFESNAESKLPSPWQIFVLPQQLSFAAPACRQRQTNWQWVLPLIKIISFKSSSCCAICCSMVRPNKAQDGAALMKQRLLNIHSALMKHHESSVIINYPSSIQHPQSSSTIIDHPLGVSQVIKCYINHTI